MKKNVLKYIIPLIICILILLVIYYYLSFNYEAFENKESVIPKNVFLTWETKILPPKMKESVETLKKENPEFTYYLYDKNERREYISKNFDKEVLNAYDALIPGAFKADLWRYCILYKMGGIYLDIKLCTVNGFKLIKLTNKEYFIRDIEPSGSGVLNGLLVCMPNNEKMMKCINQIVLNVKNKYYGENPLEPTGPMLLVKQFSDNELKNFENLSLSEYKCPTKTCISLNNNPIFAYYKGYQEEKKELLSKNNTKDYSELWENREIYDERIVF